MHNARLLSLAVAASILSLPATALAGPPGSTTLIDRPAGDAALPFDGLRYAILQSRQAMSADGNRVVFESEADALHAGEGDQTERYVYVHDRAAGTTTNLCRSSGGALGDEGCNEAGISPNGRYVVFRSASTNLVASGGGSLNLIFRRDLQTGATELMSRATGADGAAVSSGYIGNGTSVADNGTVVFATTASLSAVDTANHSDVYARVGTETRLLSRTSGGVIGNATSEAPTVSGDGSIVAFESDASNFGGTDANGDRDVYLAPIAGSSTPSIGSRMSMSNMTGNGESRDPFLSQTGQFLAFSTDATDLFSEPITSDANGATDVIRRDRISSTNTVVSLGAANAQATGRGVYGATLSADGSKVAFSGSMPGFGPGADDSATYLRNVAAATTTLVSRNAAGAILGGGSSGGVTNDGGIVAFGGEDHASGLLEDQVFVRLVAAGQTQAVSGPTGGVPAGPYASEGWTTDGALSADGGLVAFTSSSPSLAGQPADGYEHAFLRDVRTGAVRMLDLTPAGQPAAGDADGVQLSADGSTAAFYSYADDLHPEAGGESGHLFVVDLATGAMKVADRDASGAVAGQLGEAELVLSDDGGVIAFPTAAQLDPVADTNTEYDVYARDLRSGVNHLASRRDGAAAIASDSGGWSVALSGDGNRVGFTASDPNLVAGDANAKPDAFVRDLAANTTLLVSRVDGAGGAPGNTTSSMSDLSRDGTKATFTSDATDLGDGDTNADRDVHLRDLTAGTTTWISRPPTGAAEPFVNAGGGSLSADGTRVAFTSTATNLVTPDANGSGADAFVRDLTAGTVVRVGVGDGPGGAQPAGDTRQVALSGNGRCATFSSAGAGFVPGGYPSPDYAHVYLRAIDGDCPGPLPVGPEQPETPETPKGGGEKKPETRDTTAPALTALKLNRKAFATKGKKKGATLTFRLSEAATVKLEVAKTTAGRKKGKSCVAPAKAKKGAKKCTRVGKPAALATVQGKTGTSSVAITGKLGKRVLAKGTYRLLLTASDAAGNRTKTAATVDFRVK